MDKKEKIPSRADLSNRTGVEIRSNLLRIAIAEHGMTLQQFAEKVSVKNGTFHTYIQRNGKTGKLTRMPLDVYERVRTELGITDCSLEAEGDEFDWRRSTEELMRAMLMLVNSGKRQIEDYFNIFQKAAPYYLPKTFASGSFDSEAFVEALLAYQKAVAEGEETPELTDAERQQMELSQ